MPIICGEGAPGTSDFGLGTFAFCLLSSVFRPAWKGALEILGPAAILAP